MPSVRRQVQKHSSAQEAHAETNKRKREEILPTTTQNVTQSGQNVLDEYGHNIKKQRTWSLGAETVDNVNTNGLPVNFVKNTLQNSTQTEQDLLTISKKLTDLAGSKQHCRIAQNDVNQLFDSLQALLSDRNEVELFITQLGDQCPDEIAYMIFHCGKLARFATHPIAVKSIQCLMEVLNEQANLTSKLVALTFLGLRMIDQEQRFDGMLDANPINTLLKRFIQLPDLGIKSITKILEVLYGLLETETLYGSFDAHIINDLSSMVVKFDSLTSEDICAVLSFFRLVDRKQNFLTAIDADYIHFLLEKLLLGTLNPRQINDILWALEKLARGNKLQNSIKAEFVNGLLLNLSQSDGLQPINIRKLFYHLGLLAKAKQIEGPIDTNLVNTLLVKLSKFPKIYSREISQALYGLGFLALNNYLQRLIDGSVIDTLFLILLEDNTLIPQGISNPVYGVGFIAQAGCLNGPIKANTFEKLLLKFNQLDAIKCQEADNLLYGQGLIVNAGCFVGTMEATTIHSFLSKVLLLDDLDIQGISNIFNALGHLAQIRCLHGSIDAKFINAFFFKIFMLKKLDIQGIGNFFWGSGSLTQFGCISGLIYVENINKILSRVVHLINLNTNGVTSIFYCLEMIAKDHQLEGLLDAEIFNNLLLKLANLPDLDAKSVVIVMIRLTWIVKGKHFNGAIDARVANLLLQKLPQLPRVNQASFCRILYTLGILAKEQCLHGKIDADAINSLFPHMGHDMTILQFGMALYGLGLIEQAKQLSNELSSVELSSWINSFKHVLIDDSCGARQALYGISSLWPKSHCDVQILKDLFQRPLKNVFLHPSQATYLINCIVAFRDLNEELNPIFNQLLFHIVVPFEAFSRHIQERLTTNIQALAAVPTWQNALIRQLQLDPTTYVHQTEDAALPRQSPVQAIIEQANTPVEAIIVEPARQTIRTTNSPAAKKIHRPQQAGRSTPSQAQSNFPKANRNPIFNLIAKDDLTELENFLGKKHWRATQRTQTTSKKSTSRSQLEALLLKAKQSTKTTVRNQEISSEELVLQFFQDVEPQALRELIQTTKAKYFITLLRACSFHARYQLAIADSLSPIILFFEQEELRKLIPELYVDSGLGLYRDHLALMHLIDAINMRMIIHPDGVSSLSELRKAFIERGLEHHQNHRHVFNKLKSLGLQNGVFLDYDDLEEDVLEEDVEEDIADFSIEPEKGRSDHIYNLPNQMHAEEVIQPLLAEVIQIEPENFPECILDINYKYRDDLIQDILNKRIVALKGCDAKLLGSANMNDGAAHNRIADVIQLYKDHEGILYSAERQNLIIPIRYADHWVGIRLIVENGETKQVIYYNSLKKEPFYQENLMDIIEKELKAAALMPWNLSMTYHEPCMQQLDSTSCGAFLIENIYCDLKQAPWYLPPHKYAETFRKRHLSLMRE